MQPLARALVGALSLTVGPILGCAAAAPAVVPASAPAPATADARPAAPRTPAGEAAAAELEAIFGRLHAADVFHGSVLVAEAGRIVHAAHLGLADDRSRRPIDDRTLFEIASITKPLVAIATLRLVERGELGLDDPVSQHLPSVDLPGVTIRHLLSHTSGLPGPQVAGAFAMSRLAPGAVLDNARVLALLAEADRADWPAPGTVHAYSNVGYVVLAEAAAAAAGTTVDALLQREVFGPAGMTSARLCITRFPGPDPIAAVRAVDFVRASDAPGAAWTPSHETDGWAFISRLGGTAGDGGVVATTRDLLALDVALRDGRLLRPDTRAEALRPLVLADGTEHWERSWVEATYGLGWRVARDGSHWHSGDWGGAQALIKRYPETGRVVIYVVNHRVDDWSWVGGVESVVAGAAPWFVEPLR